MNKKNLSKFLSLILRHKPEELGISLDKFGWGSTNEIIEKMKRPKHKTPIYLCKTAIYTTILCKTLTSDLCINKGGLFSATYSAQAESFFDKKSFH